MQYTDSVWADRVTNINGTAITYDEIGNPLNWTDNATLMWACGRQLASFTRGNTSATYTYNDEGIRTSKTVGNVTTEYTVVDGTLYAMSDGTNTLQFFENGVLFNGTEYWYVYNAQNDVIGLIDASGEYVVRYTYSAYGLPLSKTGTMADTLGTLNPFRYRGYIYDEETGFYYVSSRYYDPVIGRFLNVDGSLHDDPLGNNIFLYCSNNPVARADEGGDAWWIAAGAIVGGVIGGVAKAITNVSTGQKWNKGILGAIAGGAVAGAIVAATGGTAYAVAGGIAAAYAGAATTSVVNQVASYTPGLSYLNGQASRKQLTGQNLTDSVDTVLYDTIVDGTVSAAVGLVTGGIANKLVPINNGWIKPQKFISCFTGKYALKFQAQTGISSLGDIAVEGLSFSAKQRSQKPTMTLFYEDTTLSAAR